MWYQGGSDMGAELWFAAAVAGPQILGAWLYRRARAEDRAGRRALAPVPLAAAGVGLLYWALGAPEVVLAAPVAVAASGALVVAGGEGGIGRGAVLVGAGLLIWCALLVAPATVLGIEAEFGPLIALLTAGVAVAALGPRLVRAYFEPSREPPLPWFLWSAGHGGWAVMTMILGLPWALIAFPVVAQVLTLGIGLIALEGAGERREREETAR